MATTPPIGRPRNTNMPEIQEQLGFNPLAAPTQPPPTQNPQDPQGKPGQPPSALGDQVSLDPERGAPVNSVPALDSWDDPSGNTGGVDARNLNFAQHQPAHGQTNSNSQGPAGSQPSSRVPAAGSPLGGANRAMLNRSAAICVRMDATQWPIVRRAVLAAEPNRHSAKESDRSSKHRLGIGLAQETINCYSKNV